LGAPAEDSRPALRFNLSETERISASIRGAGLIMDASFPVPELPATINGHTYFNKAWQRREAMANGTADEPFPVKPAPVGIRPRDFNRSIDEILTMGKLEPRNKFHWKDSDCVRVNTRYWGIGTRDRCLDGFQFNQVPTVERCKACAYQFSRS